MLAALDGEVDWIAADLSVPVRQCHKEILVEETFNDVRDRTLIELRDLRYLGARDWLAASDGVENDGSVDVAGDFRVDTRNVSVPRLLHGCHPPTERQL
jgi:hypothetical protein